MRLLLSLLSWPDGGKPDLRETASELTIGRGRESGWVLPDPKSQLSRKHCVFSPFGDGWRVTDLSLNGTFVNNAPAPLGPEQSYELHDGDQIRIGSYVIEARYQAPAAQRPPFADRFPAAPGAGYEAFPAAGFDLPGRMPENDFIGRPAADHSPAFSDAWYAPQPGRVVLPEAWDLEEAPPASPAFAPPAPAPGPAPSGGILGDDFDPFEPPVTGAPAAVTPVVPPPHVPVRPVADLPASPAAPLPPAPPAAVAAEAGGLLAAFLRGAGLRDPVGGDPLVMMEAAGAMLRAMTEGLREVRASRGQVKREFRILSTIVDPAENNPLKFSATPEAALRALLANKQAAAAVTEVLGDVRLHELATIAAMREAVRGLLETLDPAKLRDAGQPGIAGILPSQRKARAFDQYEALYARTMLEMADNFDSVFGKAFARAYERVALDDESPRARKRP